MESLPPVPPRPENQPERPPTASQAEPSPARCVLCGCLLPYQGRLCALHLARLEVQHQMVSAGIRSDWPEHHPRVTAAARRAFPAYEPDTHRARQTEWVPEGAAARRIGYRAQVVEMLTWLEAIDGDL